MPIEKLQSPNYYQDLILEILRRITIMLGFILPTMDRCYGFGKEHVPFSHSSQVDIWATGVITYILLCGFPPFVSPTNNQEELFDQILRGYYEFHSPYWDDISGSARELIVNMIQVDQDKRFSAQEVLDHPWVSVSRVRLLEMFFV